MSSSCGGGTLTSTHFEAKSVREKLLPVWFLLSSANQQLLDLLSVQIQASSRAEDREEQT